MAWRDNPNQWGSISIGLHWLTFVLVLCAAVIGLVMDEFPSGRLKLQVYAVHKSFGITVLALTALRLAWRALGKGPVAVEGTPRWQDGIARLTHGALYGLLLAVPLSGWWYNSAAGFPLRWFGLVALPKLTTYNRELKHLAEDVHEALFYALAGLILVHAMAALWHHYFARDTTLSRMLPTARPDSPMAQPGPEGS